MHSYLQDTVDELAHIAPDDSAIEYLGWFEYVRASLTSDHFNLSTLQLLIPNRLSNSTNAFKTIHISLRQEFQITATHSFLPDGGYLIDTVHSHLHLSIFEKTRFPSTRPWPWLYCNHFTSASRFASVNWITTGSVDEQNGKVGNRRFYFFG